jgi:uncharacterized RDD family membrane protein YckC
MQNIEINTTQNVRITYEVAHLGDRSFAFLIDAIIIGVGFLISLLISQIVTQDATSWLFYTIGVPFFMFYTLLSEIIMKGQTLGKKALNIQVVKLNGEEATSSDYFLRWIFRLIDIYLCVGTIAAIFVAASKKGQRLGDVVSETSAIRIKPASEMKLYEIIGKYASSEYSTKFPQVNKLTEQDMLFVRAIIQRIKKYPNDAHEEVLASLVQKLQEQLNIINEEVGTDQIKFLTVLLKDYIVLTR